MTLTKVKERSLLGIKEYYFRNDQRCSKMRKMIGRKSLGC